MTLTLPAPAVTSAVPRPSSPGTVPSWPLTTEWKMWKPTHDSFMLKRPVNFMQANPIAPNADAVAQADFAFGGNYNAHGSLDVFSGMSRGRFEDAKAAIAAAQAMQGASILGVFQDGKQFEVRGLLVSDANRRGPGDDIRSPRPEPRARPATVIPLTDIGTPNGDWGHGDFRTLSALRFVDRDLVGFVRGKDVVLRTS